MLSGRPTKIELRRAAPADVDAITSLVRAAYEPWVVVMGREPRPMLADYTVAIARHVVDLHHIAGALAALIEILPERDHLLIVNVAVAPAFQGRGLGRAMLAHAERFAHAQSLGEVRLYTNRLMAANLRLYLALGDRAVREEAFMEGAVIHMSKRLRD